jgi:serine/threonine-protein kinase
LTDLRDQLQSAVGAEYAVERELGGGGMSRVFLATERALNRQVVLKLLPPELAQSVNADRFRREIQFAARLRHPHILPVLTAHESAGLLFYTMPYVRGESLRERIRRDQQLPIDEALRLTREVADALAYAHAQGIVHRDIKPDNILLDDGHAVVMDFGIARATAEATDKLTHSGLAIGTVVYMSPEQASASSEVDARSDIYSLGCVLYEMLVGEPPFTGPTGQVITARKMSQPIPSIRIVRDTVPEPVERIVNRALAKTPADRFTAESLRAAIDQTMPGTTESVAPPPVRRSRVTWIGAAVVVAIIGIASARWAGIGSGARPLASASSIRSLAVLPLANLTGDSTQSYFADGMTEALISSLSTVRSLRVTSRTSVMEYRSTTRALPEIARKLSVDAVVEGAIQRVGDAVHLSVRLVDAAHDQQLWTQAFDAAVRDVPALQARVARAIVDEISLQLSPEERTRLTPTRAVNPAAHEAYLLGRHFLDARSLEELERARGYFEQAIARDSGFAPAYVGLAQYYDVLPFYSQVPPQRVFLPTRAAARRALELDPNLPEAHAVMAYIKAYFEWDWRGAEEEFKRALQLNPSDADVHHSYSRYLAATGRIDDALKEIASAEKLDPLSVLLKANTGMIYFFGRRYDEAIAQLQTVLALDSTFSTAYWGIGLAYEQKGDYANAIRSLERALALSPGGTNTGSSLAHVYAVSGRPRDAQRILRDLHAASKKDYVSPYHLGIVYAGLGEADSAITYIERASEERSTMLVYLGVDPRLTSLRSHPRFRDLSRRLGLPQ